MAPINIQKLRLRVTAVLFLELAAVHYRSHAPGLEVCSRGICAIETSAQIPRFNALVLFDLTPGLQHGLEVVVQQDVATTRSEKRDPAPLGSVLTPSR